MPKQIYSWHFYLISALFEATRMGIGAVSTIYLLSKGLSLSDVASIKMIQGFTILFAEVPTGLFADYFGNRLSIIAAVVASLLSFVTYIYGSNFWEFALADIFNALAISFWSGAFEAYVVEAYSEHLHKDGFLETLFSRLSSLDAIATMFGGAIGAYFYKLSPRGPFYFSLILGVVTLVLALVLLRTPESHSRNLNQPIIKLTERVRLFLASLCAGLSIALKTGLGNPKLRPFFLIQVCLQFIFQPVLHYWQPFFRSFGAIVSEASLGNIFFCYVGAQSLLAWAVTLLIKKYPSSVNKVLFAELILMSFGFGVLSNNTVLPRALLAFILVQGLSGNFRSLIGVKFNRFINSAQRATVLSSVSLISRVGMLISLSILHNFLDRFGVAHVFLVSLFGICCLVPLMIRWQKLTSSKSINAVEGVCLG
jgi:MFS family permease